MAVTRRRVAFALGVLLVLLTWLEQRGARAEVSMARTAREGADITVGFQVRNAFGIVVRPVQVKYAITDVATGTVLLTTQTVTPAADVIRIILPGEAQQIVRPGFCSVATATVCSQASDCPAGQRCLAVLDEAHQLTFEFTLAGAGRGTWDQPFRVFNNPFWPLP